MSFISYFFSVCKHQINKILGTRSTGPISKTVHQENAEYERSIIHRFLKTAFIPVDGLSTLDPPIKIIRGNYSILDPWQIILFRAYSWYNKPRIHVEKIKQIRNPSCNDQVDSVFLNRTELKDVLENPKNELETKWRSRILMEYTPRGNIIMFYDAYKEAFAYYSDQSAIPYKILNVVAMKYVMRFHCADFFLDETILGGNSTNPSPFIQIIKDEIRAENEKKKQVMGGLLGTGATSESPFVKVKTSIPGAKIAAPITKGVKSTNTVQNLMKKEEYYTKNRFVYMGKITNFSILKKPPKRRQLPPEWADFVSEYDGMFQLQTEAQKNCIDYKMFKALDIAKNFQRKGDAMDNMVRHSLDALKTKQIS